MRLQCETWPRVVSFVHMAIYMILNWLKRSNVQVRTISFFLLFLLSICLPTRFPQPSSLFFSYICLSLRLIFSVPISLYIYLCHTRSLHGVYLYKEIHTVYLGTHLHLHGEYITTSHFANQTA